MVSLGKFAQIKVLYFLRFQARGLPVRQISWKSIQSLGNVTQKLQSDILKLQFYVFWEVFLSYILFSHTVIVPELSAPTNLCFYKEVTQQVMYGVNKT